MILNKTKIKYRTINFKKNIIHEHVNLTLRLVKYFPANSLYENVVDSKR